MTEKQLPPTWNPSLLKEVTGVAWEKFQYDTDHRLGYRCVCADVALSLYGTWHEGELIIDDNVFVSFGPKPKDRAVKNMDKDDYAKYIEEDRRRFLIRTRMNAAIWAYGGFVKEKIQLQLEIEKYVENGE